MTGLDPGGIHARYEGVLKILKERKCSLAEAMEKYAVARNTLREFIGICELSSTTEISSTLLFPRRGSVVDSGRSKIELRCRAALSNDSRKKADFFLSFPRKAVTLENNKETL